MGKENKDDVKTYKSPLATPLMEGKTLEKGLKLLKKVAKQEQECKGQKGNKPLRRGMVEVTKAVKKGTKGMIFIASDIFPDDVFSHLPALCEDQKVLYAFLGARKTLGASCLSKRMSSCVMIVDPSECASISDLQKDYDNTKKSLLKNHPYL